MTIGGISSVKNLRDLGGIKGAGGRRIRSGCLIRSANLGEATEADLQKLRQEHRLRTVIDLRTAQECAELPDREGSYVYLHVPIIESFEAGITHENQTEGMPYPDLRGLYRGMMTDERCRANFRKVLTICFENDYRSGAVLWHCTEGKDRCGMTAALLLEALGADREEILQDYLETNTTNLPKAKRIYQESIALYGREAADCIYRAYIADRTYIENAWDAMGANYLTDALGFTRRDIEAFREQVLE